MLERDRVMDVRTWVRDGGDAAGLVCLSIVRWGKKSVRGGREQQAAESSTILGSLDNSVVMMFPDGIQGQRSGERRKQRAGCRRHFSEPSPASLSISPLPAGTGAQSHPSPLAARSGSAPELACPPSLHRASASSCKQGRKASWIPWTTTVCGVTLHHSWLDTHPQVSVNWLISMTTSDQAVPRVSTYGGITYSKQCWVPGATGIHGNY